MKRHVSLLLAALALQATPAWAAENWIIYKDATAAWGYDAETLKRDPQTGLIAAISATYSLAPAELDAATTYHYTMSEIVFDCDTRMARFNDIVFLDNDTKAVKTLTAGDKTSWKPVDDREQVDVIARILFRVGCEGKPPKAGGIPAGDMTSALAKMKATQ